MKIDAEAYQELGRIFSKTSLTDTERHIVWLTINYENECTYCMAAHTSLSQMARIPDDGRERFDER